ncbi:MAG: hypothetical protein QW039_05205 [Fervidicoccaceae archaeon]
MSNRTSICVLCKGNKGLCGLRECPLLTRTRSMFKIYSRIVNDLDISGMTPPSAVVGEKGYPEVPLLFNIAEAVEKEKASIYDDPKAWHGKLGLKEIVELRTSMISGLLRVPVFDPWRLYEKEISLALVSTTPVDSEAFLKKPPRLDLSFDSVLRPVGLISPLQRLIIEGSPKIHRSLEKMIWDDVLARNAVIELYISGIDVYVLERALSLGLLGVKKGRKLVPTRWAITAIDDIISDFLRDKVQQFEELSQPEVYYGEYLYNKFTIVLLPGTYEGIWIEVWHPRSIWAMGSRAPEIAIVREGVKGKPRPPDGGFSAARLAVLEHLFNERRNAKFIILREVMPQYSVPLGNWHIRETVRSALRSPPLKVNSIDEIFDLLEMRASSREAIELFRDALNRIISQKSILQYLNWGKE